MLTHYLKISFRNMWNYKSQSLVNILGLAFGVTCFVFGLFWIKYETSYNGFFPDASRMYVMSEKSPLREFPITAFENKKLLEQIPEFEQITWHSGWMMTYYGYGQRLAYVKVAKGPPDFFDFFKWTFLEGDSSIFRKAKGSIVITKQLAIKLFGNEPAVGKAIHGLRGDNKLPNNEKFVVSGVVKDFPKNCTFDFDMMVCADGDFRAIFYAKVNRHVDISVLREKFEQTSINSLYSRDPDCTWTIQPISSLHSKYFTGDAVYKINFIIIFLIAGLLGLLSAVFNFVTLSSGTMLNRSKEAVVRVIMGAGRTDLTRLFLFNILFTVFTAFVVSCLLVYILCPFFERFVLIPTVGILRLWWWVALLGMLVVTFISIILIVLLNLRNIANAFAGGKPVGRRTSLRRLMITLQLAIGCLLMMVAMTVFRQITYMKNTDTGIDIENVAEMKLSGYRSGQIPPSAVMSQLTASPYIDQACTTLWYSPLKINNSNTFLLAGDDKPLKMSILNVIDTSFFRFFRFKLKEGYFFDAHQTNYCVINQTAARIIGKDAIGSRIEEQLYQKTQEWEICGVVQDIYYEFQKEIAPTAYLNKIYENHSDIQYYARVLSQFRKEGMSLLEAVMLGGEEADGSEMSCEWLEDQLKHARKSESSMFLLFSVLALSCIVISLFGIYSLSTLTTSRRRKEIAIRKVAGAEALDIAGMFLREYLWLILIAGAIAFPVAFWLMSRWLQGYAYHVGVPLWLCASVIVAVAAIVLLTVLGQVLKAANEDPAKVVKSE